MLAVLEFLGNYLDTKTAVQPDGDKDNSSTSTNSAQLARTSSAQPGEGAIKSSVVDKNRNDFKNAKKTTLEKLLPQAGKATLIGYLLSVFQQLFLERGNLENSKNVQFVYFYLCSLHPLFCEEFLRRLLTTFYNGVDGGASSTSGNNNKKKGNEPHAGRSATATIPTRKIAVSYLGSILVRAKFISVTYALKTTKYLIEWCLANLKRFESLMGIVRDKEGNEIRTDRIETIHEECELFHLAVQVICYIMIFKKKEFSRPISSSDSLSRSKKDNNSNRNVNPAKQMLNRSGSSTIERTTSAASAISATAAGANENQAPNEEMNKPKTYLEALFFKYGFMKVLDSPTYPLYRVFQTVKEEFCRTFGCVQTADYGLDPALGVSNANLVERLQPVIEKTFDPERYDQWFTYNLNSNNFPFDPYLLRHSKSLIQPLYIDYEEPDVILEEEEELQDQEDELVEGEVLEGDMVEIDEEAQMAEGETEEADGEVVEEELDDEQAVEDKAEADGEEMPVEDEQLEHKAQTPEESENKVEADGEQQQLESVALSDQVQVAQISSCDDKEVANAAAEPEVVEEPKKEAPAGDQVLADDGEEEERDAAEQAETKDQMSALDDEAAEDNENAAEMEVDEEEHQTPVDEDDVEAVAAETARDQTYYVDAETSVDDDDEGDAFAAAPVVFQDHTELQAGAEEIVPAATTCSAAAPSAAEEEMKQDSTVAPACSASVQMNQKKIFQEDVERKKAARLMEIKKAAQKVLKKTVLNTSEAKKTSTTTRGRAGSVTQIQQQNQHHATSCSSAAEEQVHGATKPIAKKRQRDLGSGFESMDGAAKKNASSSKRRKLTSDSLDLMQENSTQRQQVQGKKPEQDQAAGDHSVQDANEISEHSSDSDRFADDHEEFEPSRAAGSEYAPLGYKNSEASVDEEDALDEQNANVENESGLGLLQRMKSNTSVADDTPVPVSRAGIDKKKKRPSADHADSDSESGDFFDDAGSSQEEQSEELSDSEE
ncbi:unnamed protein product [Amoebophrya sp. A120]|nr:unnamed protein product [Amoebophrya sp. A120]|eukprot:GSA120T00019838001.1